MSAALALVLTACNADELMTASREYANDNSRFDDWTGGDGGSSVPLPDGRVLWMLNDSFLGEVNADGSRDPGTPSVNNTIVVQQADGSIGPTLTSTVNGKPDSFLRTATPASTHYWFLDAVVEGNALKVLVVEVGGGGAPVNKVVTLSLPNLTQVGAPVTIPYLNGQGAWAQVWEAGNGYYYIYAQGHNAANTNIGYTYGARVPVGQISNPSAWRFRNGTTWETDAQAVQPIANVWGGQVVHIDDGDYVLVGMSEPLDGDIVIARGSTPMGPFGPPSVAHELDELGQPCADGGSLAAYGVVPQRQHWSADRNSAVFSYSVNCWGAKNYSGLLWDVELYRPRFVDLDLVA